MALRNGQGQRKKYLTLELSSVSDLVENVCAIVSEFQSAKIGDQGNPGVSWRLWGDSLPHNRWPFFAPFPAKIALGPGQPVRLHPHFSCAASAAGEGAELSGGHSVLLLAEGGAL